MLHVTQLFIDSGCLETLQASEGGPGCVLGEQLTAICPVAEDSYAFGTSRPFSYTSYDTALVALGCAK